MKHTLYKAIWLITGILLIVVGIIAACNPGATILSLALLFGIAILLFGIGSIVVYIVTRKYIFGSGWILADGIIATLLSIFLLCNQLTTAAMIPYIFGMWLIFSGVARLIGSFDMKKIGISGWGFMTAIGIIVMIIGFAALFHPLAAMVAVSILLGIFLIFQGIVAVLLWFFSLRVSSQE